MRASLRALGRSVDERARRRKRALSSTAADWADRARRFLVRDLWRADLSAAGWTARALRLLQFAVMVGEGFVRDRLLLRASALAYMAVLSVVPLLAVVLSILGALGVDEGLASLAVDEFAAGSPEAKQYILDVVQGMNPGSLGTVGAVTLLVTTVLALRHGEQTLNDIWGDLPGRSWTRRIADYLLILFVVPLSTAVAISLSTTLQSDPLVEQLLAYPLFETLYATGLRYAPTILLAVVFSFVYWFLPNTRVHVSAALLGGVVAALLFRAAQVVYVDFSVGVARYNAVFGSLALVPLLFVWLYVSIAIVLFGAEISFAFQHLARYRRELSARDPDPAEREALALCLAVEVARSFHARGPALEVNELADRLETPTRVVRDLLRRLERAGIVATTHEKDEEEGVRLGRPSEDVSVAEVLAAVRGRSVLPPGREEARASLESVGIVVAEIDHAATDVADRRSLADLIGPAPVVRPGDVQRGPRAV